MSDGTGTNFLRNCPTVCYLIAAAIAAIVFIKTMGSMGILLAFIIALIILLLGGFLLGMLLCKDAAATPAAMAAPAAKASAAKKPAAKKSAAKKPAAKKAPAKKTAAKKKAPALYKSKPAQVDDLKKISGVGPKLEKTCNAIGVYQYEQIAGWTKKDIAMVDDKLSFKGRIERDGWVAQAKKLAKAKK